MESFSRRVLALSLVWALVGTAWGGTIHVPEGAPTIQAALDLAVDGDRILVHPGRYPEHEIDFSGKAVEVSSLAPRDSLVVAATVVDGEGLATVFLFAADEDSASLLRGLTITGGQGDAHNRRGGGLTCIGGSGPKVRQCVIVGNGESGIFCHEAAPLLVDCLIRSNTAMRGGGVACERGATPILRACRIVDNEAVGAGGISCRGFIEPVQATLVGCLIQGNRATLENAGGLFLDHGATALLRASILAGNRAVGLGGGIENRGTLRLSNCIIRENQASLSGGGVYSSAVLEVEHCTFFANQAPAGGGAICGVGWVTAVRNSILWQSTPDELYLSADARVIHCDVQGGAWGEGNINADPEFLSARGFELVTGPGSPCLDAGGGADDRIPLCAFHPAYCDSPRQGPDLGAYGGPDNDLWMR